MHRKNQDHNKFILSNTDIPKIDERIIMCAPIWALWAGRNNNLPIEERTNVVRGSAVNTRVVKLAPLNRDKIAVNGDSRGSKSGAVDAGVRAGGTSSP